MSSYSGAGNALGFSEIASLILIYDFADDLSFYIIIVDTTGLSYKQSNIFKEKITYIDSCQIRLSVEVPAGLCM